jgi:hypothetical protein
MTEATLTEVRPGQLVSFTADGESQIGIVSETGLSYGEARVTFRPSWQPEPELATWTIPVSSMTATPAELTVQQWQQVQALAAGEYDRLHRQAAELREASSANLDRAVKAEDKIAAMRRYAIDRHLDSTICRDGLDAFLAAHDLEPYRERRMAVVAFEVDVEIFGASSEYGARRLAADNLQVVTSDDDSVRLAGTGQPAVGQVQLSAAES